MPYHTVESILPFPSSVSLTSISSAGRSDKKTIPPMNVDNVYAIPTLGPIVSEFSPISDVTTVTDISFGNHISQEPHSSYLFSVNASNFKVASQYSNTNNDTNQIHAAQLRTPMATQPLASSPVINKSVVNNPVVNKPVVNNLAVNKPVVNNPVVDKPVVNNSPINTPVTNKPTMNNPVVNKPPISPPVLNNNPVINRPIVTDTAIPQAVPTVPHINIPIPTAGYTSTLITDGLKPNVVITVKELPDEDTRLRPCYRENRKVPFSQYWIPKENEWDETNNGKRVYLGGNVKKRLMDNNNVELGLVPVDMYEKCHMEGTVRDCFFLFIIVYINLMVIHSVY